MMTYQNQKNGCYQPPPHGSKQDHLSPDVARLIQLEEGIRPLEKKKHAHSSHHKRDHRDKDHCSVDMNGLETNVWKQLPSKQLLLSTANKPTGEDKALKTEVMKFMHFSPQRRRVAQSGWMQITLVKKTFFFLITHIMTFIWLCKFVCVHVYVSEMYYFVPAVTVWQTFQAE